MTTSIFNERPLFVRSKMKSSWKLLSNDDSIKRPATLRGLLSHTAGVTLPGFPGYGPDVAVPSLVDILTGEEKTPEVVVDQTPRMN